MSLNSGVQIKSALYLSGSDTLPTAACIFAEASGTGSIQILWSPGSISSIFLNSVTDPSMKIAEREYVAAHSDRSLQQPSIHFRDFSDLSPSLRFPLCCGPLPQLNLLQKCVNGAIFNGTFQEFRFLEVGFTALEWAAKKGNMDIVT